MRKKITCVTVICVLFSLVVLLGGYSLAQEEAKSPVIKTLMSTYQGPTVTISGRVTCTDCKEGQQIRISAKSFPEAGPADIAFVVIPGPGDYSLKVPQNIKDVYLIAIVLKKPAQIRPGEDTPERVKLLGVYGLYSDKPLRVRDSDIASIDIIIKTRPPFIMSTYQGPTVTISGRVTCTDCKEGQQIRISAKSFPGAGPADIAFVVIPGPGDYSLKVPQNIGDVYLVTPVLLLEEEISSKNILRPKYGKVGPIKVKTKDISGINISIKADLKNSLIEQTLKSRLKQKLIEGIYRGK